MKSYSVAEYQRAGCTDMKDAMLAIHVIADGKVCDTGCWAFDDGKCPAYRRLTFDERAQQQQQYDRLRSAIGLAKSIGQNTIPQTETVRQEATRRGVSISQVRKERQEVGNG